ncbi:MFS transporter [Saccharomonospora sp. NPDC046836]|uniref:MFS transporter n=1 Tax=Saccharomonospora sp. NPDC046836 TaxID=3156921 RepID=UPI0033E42CB3
MTSTLIDNAKFSRFHLRLTLATFGGIFLDGYIMSALAIALPGVEESFDVSPSTLGVLGSTIATGLLFGAVIVGRLSDRIGRQLLFMLHFLVIIVASIGAAFSTSTTLLAVLLIVSGITIGADYSLSPALLVEWLPRKSRGRILTLLGFMWFVGASAAYAIGYALVTTQGADAWRLMLGSTAVFAFLFALGRIGLPESPRWLVNKGQLEKARGVLARVYRVNVTDEMLRALNEGKANTGRNLATLWTPRYRRRLIFCVLFWTFSIVPLNIIYVYSPLILEAFNMSGGGVAILGALVISLVSGIGIIPALLFVEKIGRRPLIVGSFGLMTVPLVILGVMPHGSIALVIVAFCAYALFTGGPSFLQALYPSELFATELRGTALGITVSASRAVAVIMLLLTPIALNSIGTGPVMLIAAAFSLAGFVSCLVLAPETRGLALADASNATHESPERNTDDDRSLQS